MTEDIEKKIDREKFQVLILYCPAYFPFNFFRHPWFVLNEKGNVSRWEVRHHINKQNNNYLFVNNQNPFEGINKFPYIKSKWNARFLKLIEGDLAEKITNFIKTSGDKYPYINNYCLNGPNSNTYLVWVLNNFPEINLELSSRFIGKDYKISIK